MQNQDEHESRVWLTTIKIPSMHFKALYTTLVIRNIAQIIVGFQNAAQTDVLNVMHDDL